MAFLFYPLLLLHFWYIEVPVRMVRFFGYLNIYLLHLMTVPLLLRTFFKPAKLEYRKGLIGFSIFTGILVKSILLFANFVFLIVFLVFEISIFIFFLIVPISPFFILFF